MRVLYVSDVYFPRVNGVSTSIRTFLTDLASIGVEPLLVAPEYPGTVAVADEHPVVRVPSSAVPGDPEDRRMHWSALQRALDALPHPRFDLVHAQTPFLAHYAASRFARARAVPLVETYHTLFEEYLHHYVPVLPRGLGRAVARAFTRSQCSAVDTLIAPSEPMRDVLSAYGVTTPIEVVPTGLPPDRFQPGDGTQFRLSEGIEPDRPLLTYIGRVAHEKNIGFLVRAFAEVRRKLPEALFMIAGEGPALPSLREQVAQHGLAESVRFVGYLERDSTLLDCYAAADVFVFASRTETQGLVLLEAMAQGTPVVSTAELGARSILVGNCGALVVEEEPDAFASAVLAVLADPGVHNRLAREAREHARRWSSMVTAGRLRDVYDRALERKGGAMSLASHRPTPTAK